MIQRHNLVTAEFTNRHSKERITVISVYISPNRTDQDLANKRLSIDITRKYQGNQLVVGAGDVNQEIQDM